MRLFIGIPLPPAVTERLAGLRTRLERPGDGLRWSRSESWHITLQFLGAVTEPQFHCVVEHLNEVSAPEVSLCLEEPGFFERAGVFFVDVSVKPQLTRLQLLVTGATSRCGFTPEDRPYHPHITLAREKGRSGGIRNLKRRLQAGGFDSPRFPTFTAQEFLLYESIPSPSGSRYEVRARFPFASH